MPVGSLYAKICQLPLTVESVSYEGKLMETGSGWMRSTTTVLLHGAGCVGRGEDVTYSNEEQQSFLDAAPEIPRATYADFEAYSRSLDALEPHLFATPPAQASARLYRRWAYESAGLDLALRQANTNLAELLATPFQPMRFVASTGLGNPPSTASLQEKLAASPNLEFKIDYSEGFDDEFLRYLSAFKIACIDYKGHYHGEFSGAPVDVERYAAVAKAFPDAILEDPGFAGLPALNADVHRLSWDYPVKALADLIQLPKTAWLNIKPSRFGLLSELLRTLEYAQAQGLQLYGGGQFELGVGRTQAQQLAALFYPDGPNDLAPADFNMLKLLELLPSSPLTVTDGIGFG
ncbi:MAG: hypothetical protein HQ519_16045 [Planctomycetes bacterium]|nr:hypothetical protein [Planctomycetota bacterium]